MRTYRKKAAAAAFLVYMALWVAGCVRGLTLEYPPPPPEALRFVSYDDVESSQRVNWNNLKQIGLEQTPLPMLLDQPDVEKLQVFEKRAQLAAGSTDYDKDQAALRVALLEYKAAVVHEKSHGIAPHRRFTVEVGVQPEKFDAFVEQLRQVGRLENVTVLQRDRTAEFRKLNSQRQALKKYLESILKLREGEKRLLEDALKLEQKIQDIEKELQSVGVQLGDLVGKEAYYHVIATLHEYQPGSKEDRTYSVPQRLFHGTIWAIAWWLAAMFGAALVVGTVLSVRELRPGRSGEPSRT